MAKRKDDFDLSSVCYFPDYGPTKQKQTFKQKTVKQKTDKGPTVKEWWQGFLRNPFAIYSRLQDANKHIRSSIVDGWGQIVKANLGHHLDYLITASQAAKLLGVKPSYISKLAKENRVRSIKLDRGVYKNSESAERPSYIPVFDRDVLLLHVGDVLALAGEKLKRTRSHSLQCNVCDWSAKPGESCPVCDGHLK